MTSRMLRKPKVLIIGDTALDCLGISYYFTNFVEFIDYETVLSDVSFDDYRKYDVFVYDYDNIDHNYLNFFSEVINVVLISSADDLELSRIMNSGVDIIIQKEIEIEKVKHAMLVCSLIMEDHGFE
jgi:hypothetical protein